MRACIGLVVIACGSWHQFAFFGPALIFLGYFFPATPFLSIPWRGELSFEDLLRREGRKTAAPKDFVFLGTRSEHIGIAAADAGRNREQPRVSTDDRAALPVVA